MGFPRQELWSELPFPSPGDLLDPGIEPLFPALAGRFFTTEPPGKPSLSVMMYLLHVIQDLHVAWISECHLMLFNFSLELCHQSCNLREPETSEALKTVTLGIEFLILVWAGTN